MRDYFWSKDEINLKLYNENYKQYVHHVFEDEDICLMIIDKDENCTGYIILSWIDERMRKAEVYIFIEEEYRRNGYGTSAMEIILQYAFEERRLHKVQCCTKAYEIGAADFLYQLGFKLEAARTEMFLYKGNPVTEYYYGMLENEYHNKNRIKLKGEKCSVEFLKNIPNSNLGEFYGEKFENFNMSIIKKENNFWYFNGLKFRGMTEDDFRINNRIIFDSKVCRFYDDDVKLPGDLDKISDYDRKHLNLQGDDRISFAIEEGGKYIGCVNLCGIDKENKKFSASIYLCPEGRGKGYGTIAMNFALTYAFSEYNMHKFIACVSDGNIASARMMRKIGCKVEGVQREAAFVGGKYVDTIFFGVTAN